MLLLPSSLYSFLLPFLFRLPTRLWHTALAKDTSKNRSHPLSLLGLLVYNDIMVKTVTITRGLHRLPWCLNHKIIQMWSYATNNSYFPLKAEVKMGFLGFYIYTYIYIIYIFHNSCMICRFRWLGYSSNHLWKFCRLLVLSEKAFKAFFLYISVCWVIL